TADYLQQFIVAKVGERLCRTCRFSSIRCYYTNIAARVVDCGYRCVSEQTKASLKQASGTKAFGCVGKNLRSTLSTNPGYAAHFGRVACALPVMYCAEFRHTLRSQHTDQMAQLIFDIAGNGHSVADFFAQ